MTAGCEVKAGLGLDSLGVLLDGSIIDARADEGMTFGDASADRIMFLLSGVTTPIEGLRSREEK